MSTFIPEQPKGQLQIKTQTPISLLHNSYFLFKGSERQRIRTYLCHNLILRNIREFVVQHIAIILSFHRPYMRYKSTCGNYDWLILTVDRAITALNAVVLPMKWEIEEDLLRWQKISMEGDGVKNLGNGRRLLISSECRGGLCTCCDSMQSRQNYFRRTLNNSWVIGLSVGNSKRSSILPKAKSNAIIYGGISIFRNNNWVKYCSWYISCRISHFFGHMCCSVI